MKQLFYIITCLSICVLSCKQSSDKGELEIVSGSTALGEAGTLTFSSSDSLMLTADYYPNEESKGIVILLHQAKFSRGEYNQIAKVLVDSGFACFALDLRSGGAVNGVVNESAALASKMGKPTGAMDALQDIRSAISFIAKNSTKEIYLWGSSYSASLALMEATTNNKVKKVVAFSPGEYLLDQNTVKSAVSELVKPAFITAANAEFDVLVKPIAGVIPSKDLVIYKPSGLSDHGSKTLWLNGPQTEATYRQVVAFLKN